MRERSLLWPKAHRGHSDLRHRRALLPNERGEAARRSSQFNNSTRIRRRGSSFPGLQPFEVSLAHSLQQPVIRVIVGSALTDNVVYPCRPGRRQLYPHAHCSLHLLRNPFSLPFAVNFHYSSALWWLTLSRLVIFSSHWLPFQLDRLKWPCGSLLPASSC